jgi:hypothetical protein
MNALLVDAVSSFEMSANICQTTWCNIPEDRNPNMRKGSSESFPVLKLIGYIPISCLSWFVLQNFILNPIKAHSPQHFFTLLITIVLYKICY